MKRKLTVVAAKIQTLKTISNYLNEILSEYLEINEYLVSSYNPETDDGEIVVFSGRSVMEALRQYVGNRKYFMSEREIDYRNLHLISTIKSNSMVYVVNDNQLDAITSLESIKAKKINKLNFIPFYPGVKEVEGVNIALSIGEKEIVPDSVDHIVELGTRIPSISAIIEICNAFDIPPQVINSVSNSYMSNLIKLIKDNQEHLEKIHDSSQVMTNIFDNSIDGLCLVDPKGVIKTISDRFSGVVGFGGKYLIGSNMNEVFRRYDFDVTVENLLYEAVVVKNATDREILLNAREFNLSSGMAKIVYATYTSDIRDLELAVRKNTDYKKNIEKYEFKDYLTRDVKTLDMLERTKKVAINDFTILIQGESGTGKEILAQSIHNASNRRSQPFVPVNFAAIQPNLLESELFGYAEGSFTGALKGGSKGLFEMAHKGTLFFDEIGDAPLSFQVRLLRVLQEQEIRRVGDTKRIPIDVRIIAATNKDLFTMINNKEFREDLFYRICVIPIDTIPIRERHSDISYIMDFFLKKAFNDNDVTLKKMCTSEVFAFLKAYGWGGNVREIINVVTYFTAIKGAQRIGMRDLPKYMFRKSIDKSDELSSLENEILKVISKSPKIGRRKILESLMLNSFEVTEAQVRTYLKKLSEKQLIKINNTRGGCEVTKTGESLVE